MSHPPDNRRAERWGDGSPVPTLGPSGLVELAIPGGLCGPSIDNIDASNGFGNSRCREINEDAATCIFIPEAQMVCAMQQGIQHPASPSSAVPCESDFLLPKLDRLAVPDLAWPADLFAH